MRPALPLAVVLVALLLAGCGAGSQDSAKDFSGAKRQVADVVEDVESAAGDDDPAKVCSDLLAQSLLTRLERAGTNCRTAVGQGFDDADDSDLDVDAVTITGTRATAKVKAGSGDDEKTETMLFQREGTDWKIASLGTR